MLVYLKFNFGLNNIKLKIEDMPINNLYRNDYS